MNVSGLVVGFWVLGASLFLTKHRGNMTKAEKVTVLWSLFSILVFASVADANSTITPKQIQMMIEQTQGMAEQTQEAIEQIQEQFKAIEAYREMMLEYERKLDIAWEKKRVEMAAKIGCHLDCFELTVTLPPIGHCDLACNRKRQGFGMTPTLKCDECKSSGDDVWCVGCESDGTSV